MASKKAKQKKVLEKAKQLVLKNKKGKAKAKPKQSYPEGQNAPQSKAYQIDNDKTQVAKGTGWRFTKEGAKRLGKTESDRPTQAEIEKYRNQTFKVKGKVNKSGPKGTGDGSFRYIYIERRADKADLKRNQKLAHGGETAELKLLVDSRHGVYVPKVFVEQYDLKKFGISDADAKYYKEAFENPDSDEYYDAWDDLLRKAKTDDGETITQADGDLFLVPEGYEYDDFYAKGGKIELRIHNVDKFDKHYDEVGFSERELSTPYKKDGDDSYYTKTKDDSIAQQLQDDGLATIVHAKGGKTKDKKAVVVSFNPMTRVIVSAKDSEEEIVEKAREKMRDDLSDYLSVENLDEIKDDSEMPYNEKDDYDKGGKTSKLPIENDVLEFQEYVFSYYGKGGMYAKEFFDGGVTTEELLLATNQYLTFCNKSTTWNWGRGDTFDREVVRDIMLYNRGENIDDLEHSAFLKKIKKTTILEYGGILQPMIGGVNADPRFDIYNTTMFAEDGAMLELGGENPDEMLKVTIHVDVYEDDYEEGEGKRVHGYTVDWLKNETIKADDLLNFLGRELGLSNEPNDYTIDDDGYIHTSRLEDSEGLEASQDEIDLWKLGGKKLYSAQYTIIPEAVGQSRKPSQSELHDVTDIPMYEDGGEMAKGGKTKGRVEEDSDDVARKQQKNLIRRVKKQINEDRVDNWYEAIEELLSFAPKNDLADYVETRSSDKKLLEKGAKKIAKDVFAKDENADELLSLIPIKNLATFIGDDDEYAKGGITREGDSLMHFEPYFEKDVKVATIDEEEKEVRPSHGYFHPNKVAKKSIAWAHKNGYKFMQDGKEFEDGGDTDEYAKGGKIKDQYKQFPKGSFKREKGVWNAWTPAQRLHFLNDHADELTFGVWGISKSDFLKISEVDYDGLSDLDDEGDMIGNEIFVSVNDALNKHIQEGQYADGGKIVKRRYLQGRGKNVFTFGYGMPKDSYDMFGTKGGTEYFIMPNGKVYKKTKENMNLFEFIGTQDEYAKGGKTHEQGYDDREDESLAMRHGKIATKDFVGSHKRREHSRRDDAQFETRNKK